jgi:hypothetical protein
MAVHPLKKPVFGMTLGSVIGLDRVVTAEFCLEKRLLDDVSADIRLCELNGLVLDDNLVFVQEMLPLGYKTPDRTRRQECCDD